MRGGGEMIALRRCTCRDWQRAVREEGGGGQGKGLVTEEGGGARYRGRGRGSLQCFFL